MELIFFLTEAKKGYEKIIESLKRSKVQTVISVPDSSLDPLLRGIRDDSYFTHVAACSEEEGITICCGVLLTGKRSVMILQNAGLLSSGCALNFAKIHNIPLFLLVSYRGGIDDPIYYHLWKGRSTTPFLKAMEIAYAVADESNCLDEQVKNGILYSEGSMQPFALLLKVGSLT